MRWCGIIQRDIMQTYFQNLGIALAHNPAVAWYCKEKVPEIAEHVEKLIAAAPNGCTKEQIRQAECMVLGRHDWAVVYVYPEIMNQNCPYIYNWDKRKFFELAELGRITKSGGWILVCPGEDDRKAVPEQEMLKRGFEYFYYVGKTGGDIYRYRKQVIK